MKKILKENWIYMLIIIILVVIMCLIMHSSLYNSIIMIDQKVIEHIKSIHNVFLINLFRVITIFGDIYIPTIILLCLLGFCKNKLTFWLQGCSYAFAGILTYFSKLIIARPRPTDALITIPSSFSFPSGHTLTSFVFYMILLYLLSYKKTRNQKFIVVIIAVVFSILIAFSRVYLGVHYFSDVMGGVILAVPCVLMIKNIINKNFDKKLLSK